MAKESKLLLRVLIHDPELDIFRVDESYDIRQLITNKKDKFDVSSSNPNDFIQLFNKIRKLSPIIFYDQMLVFWFGIGSIFGFIVTLGCCAQTTQMYLSNLGLVWGIFMIPCSLLFIIFPILYIIPVSIFCSYNHKYLKQLRALFQTMQNEGYIEKDLSKYPESLQMAFWPYHWYDWHADLNHYIRHWSWFYGFLALKYFFWAYDNLQFPIDEKQEWSSWFNQFTGCYYMSEQVIYKTFHHDY